VIGSAAVFRSSIRLLALHGFLAGAVVCGRVAAAGTLTHPPLDVAVGPQYDSTHVYVAPGDLDAFVSSFVATFGGHASKPIVSTVTPTPSSAQFQYIMSPPRARPAPAFW
jgi:hypothetical protein